MRKLIFNAFISWLMLLPAVYAQKPVKVACIGASITYGARIENREQNSYPAQLQKMLGDSYNVTNYGVSGTTLLRKGNLPYWNTKEYQAALASNPDIVVIDLGGNDAKLINRSHYDEFENDYRDFIKSFTQLPSHPRIVLLSAMASFVKDTTQIWDQVIVKRINPMIQQVAYTEKVEVLDMHSPFVNKEELFSDKLHPDKEGAGIMATTVYNNLAQKRDKDFNILNNIKQPVKLSSFYGYECADFTFNGRACKIARPKLAAKGHPWIWRARFWAHEPQTDIALLQQGFHVVYCDVVELMGNGQCISLWNSYYDLLHKAGLSKKALMEGMSRGGVYVFNWAAVNPEKVAGVYVDNPLLNTSALILKVMKTTNTKVGLFEDFKKDYGLTTTEDLINFKDNPVDKVKQIVKGGYPILILCADADEEVPPQDNTLLFEQKVRELNGNITVIHKPGFKHHPHSLPNPEPIVDFLLKAGGYELPVPLHSTN
jgi:lysophospholipase L1-like esterase